MSTTTWIALALSTFASEDLACVTAGLLFQQGRLSAASAISSCAVGIFVGDIGLWTIGRLGGDALNRWRWVGARIGGMRTVVHDRLRGGVPLAILGSRFLPGTRLALYVTSGIVGVPLVVFAGWSALAVLVWTPVVVLGSAGLDSAVAGTAGGAALLSPRHAFVLVMLALALTALRAASSADRPWRLAVAIQRVAQWEFWPMWAFYAPLVPWVAWLSLRHGGVTTMTAANPGMPDGGTIGESKADILSRLPVDVVLPFRLVRGTTASARVAAARRAVAECGDLPVILKPDVGERGRGVTLARSIEEVDAYCLAHEEPFLVQQYHRGPYEAGIFYYRLPDAARGHILSITDKRFPVVTGDGTSTLEALVRAHPRYRLQAGLFLARHAAHREHVLARGQRFQLTDVGNHSKGTMFLDGERLRTEALEARIDEVARRYSGFHIGRFDIRYADETSFAAGRDFAILELNGATAEATDLYDPRHSLWRAYGKLFRQWRLVFEIGAANRRNGAPATPVSRLVRLARLHLHPSTAAG